MLNNKSDPLRYMMISGRQSQKKFFSFILTLLLGSAILIMGYKIHLQYFLSSLYLYDSIFSGIVRIDKLHDFDEGIGSRKKVNLQLS